MKTGRFIDPVFLIDAICNSTDRSKTDTCAARSSVHINDFYFSPPSKRSLRFLLFLSGTSFKLSSAMYSNPPATFSRSCSEITAASSRFMFLFHVSTTYFHVANSQRNNFRFCRQRSKKTGLPAFRKGADPKALIYTMNCITASINRVACTIEISYNCFILY